MIPFRWPVSLAGRRRREARQKLRLREVDGFLDDLHADLGDARSTLVRAVEGYRRTLRAP
ncbi:MAG TPA: hypothetical protein VGJ11_04260 [Gaiellales bacterium]